MRIFEDLILDHPKILLAYRKQRSKFLESEVESIMLKSFPEAIAARNVKWRIDENEYETDLLLKINSILFIIEAKSGMVTRQALRGAKERIRRHIENLFIEPSMQSKRFETHLNKIINEEIKDDNLMSQLPFDIKSIHKTIRLSITLEELSALQSNITNLRTTGWIPNEYTPTPTMTLADLEIVMDFLNNTSEKIHYLIRRIELESSKKYIGDEIDLLGLYVETNFNLGEAEASDEALIITGTSKRIDHYYIAKDSGFHPPKPTPKLSKRWTDIITKLEQRQIERWPEIATILLNVPYVTQKHIETSFLELKKKILNKKQSSDNINSYALMPPPWRKETVTMLALRKSEMSSRLKLINNVAQQTLLNCHASKCLVIAINIDSDDYPYSVIALMDRIQ